MNFLHYVLVAAVVLTPHVAEAKIPRSKAAVSEFKRQNPCPITGLRKGKCPGYQVDHIIPLKCSGPDTSANMQWLSVEDHKLKTRKEAKLCKTKL
ncbi:HNH endonuclease [Undibacterium sp. NL8W]|uniref:HNH endonuclease n=1 Tax=Undibacterium umbellatum TaxID=2762300 RepID=A0ABR6Z3X2_9BURK|nr:HNH endonuclease [Undibacterium umbellatum]